MSKLYDPNDVGKLYAARTAEFTSEGRSTGLTPAAQDTFRSILLLVDVQVDFVHADGTLSVPGAIEDTRRTIDFIYSNPDLTAIAASLDSHIPFQIFYPTWWKNQNGEHPEPFTLITLADIDAGVWRPVREPKWSREYVKQLEQNSKKVLAIWPEHTMIGTTGHALVPALSEAIAYHSAARTSQPTFLTKGTIPQVEHYGILEPEVAYPKHPSGGLNTAFLDMVARYDRIYVAGQAKSHCVLETMAQLVDYFGANQPEVIEKIYFLTDCTSSVFHPDIDFDAIAEAELAKMEAKGVVMIKSTEV